MSRMGEKIGAYRFMVGRREGKIQLEKPRHGWEDNTKTDLQEVGWGDMDWIDLAQETDSWRVFVNEVMKLRVP